MRTVSDFDGVLRGLDAIAVDLPGFGGATPPPEEPWGSPEYAKAVVPVLESYAAPPVVLGHSFGGRVAIHLAADHPELVRALVLTAVPAMPRSDRPPASSPLAYRVAKALNARGLLSDERMEARRRRSGSADYRNASGVIRDVFVRVVNERYDEQLGRITCPVELVWAADDDQVPPSVGEEMASRLAHANLTVLPRGGHLTPLTIPDALRDALRRRLTS
jgi:pimeloyl-ACP methyl ester carboxylesterase